MIRKYFAVGSILFLLMLIVVAIDNYNREWKGYQRQYWIEKLAQRAKEQKGAELNLWERLLVRFNAEMNLTVKTVVTEEWRGADTCMTCHIDEGRLLKQHSRLIVEQLPFDKVGCTACHGGDPLALTVNGAHKGLRDRYEKIFEQSLEELNSERAMTRQKAIEHIRWMTGNDFGFGFSDPPERRAQAIESIKAWWTLHKGTFIAEGFGKRTEPFTLKNPQEKLIEKRTDVSIAGEELKFVGSPTCVACHANPQISDVYIPESSKEHVERWFIERFMTSRQPEAYKDHPLLLGLIEDPEKRDKTAKALSSEKELQHSLDMLKQDVEGFRAQGREEEAAALLPQIEQLQQELDKLKPPIEEFTETIKALDVTCEACHGPGSEYALLMQKGLGLQYQGEALQAQHTALKQKIEELEHQLNPQLKELRDQKNSLEAEIKALRGEAEELDKQGRKQEATARREQITKLEARLKDLQETIERHRVKLREISKELRRLDEEEARLAQEIERLFAEATGLLGRSKEIARSNAYKNIQSPEIWRIFERLIAGATKK